MSFTLAQIDQYSSYRQVSHINRTLVGNKQVDHSYLVGAACRSCSSYIFNLDLTPGFDGLGTDNCKTILETLKVLGIGRLILEVWRYCEATDTAWHISTWQQESLGFVINKRTCILSYHVYSRSHGIEHLYIATILDSRLHNLGIKPSVIILNQWEQYFQRRVIVIEYKSWIRQHTV